ncbi:MAG: pyruvate synthase [Proteobacteria bacterium]|nr:pyruvate synthase [Pseudomonadota bacterium]
MSKPTSIHSMKDLPSTHLLGAGTAMCAGCGGLEALHQIYDLLGSKTVFINAAGCMTLLAVYPFTPFRGGFLYTSMASAPAGAQGVRDALDILLAKGRLPREEDMTAVVLAGDGSSYGMGLSATSAAIERGLDFHRPAYVATVIGADPLDLARKIETAARLKGPRLILALSPCPTGWDFDPSLTVEIGRLAVKTGLWPLKEFVDGEVVHTRVPRPRTPVEEYLKLQGRFRHLFEPKRDDRLIGEIQSAVERYWERVR